MQLAYRAITGLMESGRATRTFPKPRPSNPRAKLGLAYERKVGKELLRHLSAGHLTHLEHGSWFSFADDNGPGFCSPDFLLHLPQGIFVVEVKLTWVEVAMPKLEKLYLPVVSTALAKPVGALVICKNLTPGAPAAHFTMREAILSPTKLLVWNGNGRLLW